MKNHFKISLKKANFSDIEFLWYLRNKPETYKYSRQNQIIGWKEYIEWILPIVLGTSNKDLFVIKNLKTPIGQIRFDWMKNKKAEISMSILKEFQGKGFATETLKLAIKEVKRQKKIKRLIAEIHKKNLSSIKLFERLSFKLKTQKRDWLKYILDL